jgi:hypothetical protein
MGQGKIFSPSLQQNGFRDPTPDVYSQHLVASFARSDIKKRQRHMGFSIQSTNWFQTAS